MATHDETLAAIFDGLAPELRAADRTRLRGGLAHGGTAWAEASGRLPDGAWTELRLHHRPAEQRVEAGLLLYEPLARGGRTVSLGHAEWRYRDDPAEQTAAIQRALAAWCDDLIARTQRG